MPVAAAASSPSRGSGGHRVSCLRGPLSRDEASRWGAPLKTTQPSIHRRRGGTEKTKKADTHGIAASASSPAEGAEATEVAACGRPHVAARSFTSQLLNRLLLQALAFWAGLAGRFSREVPY
jgi:hypothetical protein